MSEARCDVLCVAPHTDDAEIALGGTLALLAARGRRVWVCDLTRGELASNADPDERWREAEAASEVLGLAGRVQLSLPDGFVTSTDRAQVEAVVWVLRTLRPRWVLAAPEPRRHPDHLAAPELLRRAVFLARLVTLEPAAPQARCWPQPPPDADGPWICESMATTALPDQQPELMFDVTDSWSTKLVALACFASQFQRDSDRRDTHINSPEFLTSVEARGRAWGRRAGVEYAEALVSEQVPVLDDLPGERWS